ncbi:trypsin-like peptidase domain-containing protein [Streptomyces coeruleorubidus]|uniref:trypsin-like peptidase domain-containing protein n=1 Tax=Streptomyces coeruleorubidus TaxID=116188 RepID=UPI0033A14F67
MRADRVAEVIAVLPGGSGRRGSGYLVAAGTVLTAAHVIADARAVRVRFDADRPGERIVEATVEWRHTGTDTAVLAVPGGDGAEAVEAARFGRVEESDAVLSCTAVGFPRFKLRTDPDGTRYRDVEHVRGACAVLSNRREGTLDLQVTPPATDPDTDASPWEGMSGAAVLSGGRIVGVVARHHRGDGPGRLAANRVDRWAEHLTAEERLRLEALLGCALAPTALPDVVPPTARVPVQVREAYEAQLRDMAPQVLEDRDAELRRLAEFCGGPDPYLWVQAPPWAGKTALVAWLALHPPRGVVPVWFFVTARLAGQADSPACTEAFVQQLAVVAGREPTRHAAPAVRDGERRQLLNEAAQRVADDGGTLLLIVDGLDEDQSSRPGGSGPSIASLLPERLPPHVRALVTSRLSPGLPADVPGGHPLRHCAVLKLDTVAAARHTEHEAVHDLTAALSGGALGRDLVGLLAAAHGSLTLSDLRELTGHRHLAVKQRLDSTFGRILRERADGPDGFQSRLDLDGARPTAHPAETGGFLFAHETLFAAALEAFGPDITAYRERVHAWARRYAEAGWPTDTPAYLLQFYGRMVAALGDVDRATALVTDVRRHDRMRERTGGDTAGLAEIEVVHELAMDLPCDDLGPMASLAVARDLLTRRNGSLPPEVPIALAELGHTRRAMEAAHAVFRPEDRAHALAGIAQVLAANGDPQTADVAREALRTVDVAEANRWELMPSTDHAMRTAAAALMTVGQEDEACVRLDSPHDADPLSPIRTRVALAVAAYPRAAELATGLLREAVTMARALPPDERVEALAVAAGAYATIDPAQAKRLYAWMLRLANRAETEVALLTAVAVALRDVRPEQAADFAHSALAELRIEQGWQQDEAEFTGREYEPSYDWIVDSVAALLAAGLVDEAQQLVEQEEAKPIVWFAEGLGHEQRAIAVCRARQGDAETAWRLLEMSWRRSPVDERHPEGAAAVSTALAAAGCGRQAETLLRTAAARHPWAAAEGLAALARHYVADDPEHAAHLMQAAESVAARSSQEAGGTDQDIRLAVLATTLAVLGRFTDAERLADEIGTPCARAWAYAGVSMAHAAEGHPHALRLAETAAEIAEDLTDDPFMHDAQIAAAQALGCLGAAEQAVGLANSVQHPIGKADQEDRDKALMAAVTGLWAYDPAAATGIVDAMEQRLLTGDAGLDGPVVGFAGLLVAVGHQDYERSRRLADAAQRAAERKHRLGSEAQDSRYMGTRPQDGLVMGLLTAGSDPACAGEWLLRAVDLLESESSRTSWNRGPLAIVCAALGDYKAALGLAFRSDHGRRAEVLTEFAAYVAGVPGTTVFHGNIGSAPELWLIRRFAALVMPAEAAESRQLAADDGSHTLAPDKRRSIAFSLLSQALLSDGWHNAVPVLADLAPDVVISIRDVVFQHLGLED